MIRVGTGILEYSFGPQISCLQPAAGHVRASVLLRFLTGLQRLPLRVFVAILSTLATFQPMHGQTPSVIYSQMQYSQSTYRLYSLNKDQCQSK